MMGIKKIILLLLLFPIFSYADMGDFTKTYLEEIENKNGSAFMARCSSVKNDQDTATLIFEIGKEEGLLIEERNKVIVNLATVKIDKKGPLIEETHGGVYSYERVKKLVNEIVLHHQFHLLIPFKVKAVESIKIEGKCANTP